MTYDSILTYLKNDSRLLITPVPSPRGTTYIEYKNNPAIILSIINKTNISFYKLDENALNQYLLNNYQHKALQSIIRHCYNLFATKLLKNIHYPHRTLLNNFINQINNDIQIIAKFNKLYTINLLKSI